MVRIDQLGNDDVIKNPITGRDMPVDEIRIGIEKEALVHIHTQQGSIKVTNNHPMLVVDLYSGEERIKFARELEKTDIIKTEMGEQFITRISSHVETDYVYNIRLGGSDRVKDMFVLANGFVAGDLRLQYMMENKQKDNGMVASDID